MMCTGGHRSLEGGELYAVHGTGHVDVGKNQMKGLQDANGVIGIGHRHDLISSPIQSLSISDCDPRAAVVIALSLRRQYLQNGNIRGRGWRLSAIAAPRLPNWESGDEIERAESRRLRPISRFQGNLTDRTPEWLAGGAVLIEPVSRQNPC